MDLSEIGWEGVEWIHDTKDRDKWHLVNLVMNLLVPQKMNFILAKQLLASQGVCYMKLVKSFNTLTTFIK